MCLYVSGRIEPLEICEWHVKRKARVGEGLARRSRNLFSRLQFFVLLVQSQVHGHVFGLNFEWSRAICRNSSAMGL